MELDQVEIDRLVAQPSETRAVEIKAWIDPRVPEGKAKILTAALALRNFDGGRILIGFHDETLQPLPMTPVDLLGAYNNDDIQAITSKYASDPFDVVVGYGERNGTKYPVIAINGGIRTPVAVKIPLTSPNGSSIIKKGIVFFRTLLANGTVSSAEAQPGDWPEIMQICMDNREADIGRFVRRHLTGIDSTSISAAFASLTAARATFPSLTERASSWLDEGNRRAEAAISRWYELPHDNEPEIIKNLSEVGAWEVGLVIDPHVTDLVADNQFYHTVASNVPEYSGWPIWCGTRGHMDKFSRHVQREDGWEALIASTPEGFWDHLEFQRWEPNGQFYLRRLYDDDAAARIQNLNPGRLLDLGRAATRVAEAMIAGISIAKALRCDEDSAILGFSFRWSGLEGRRMSFWASQLRYALSAAASLDQTATAFVPVPLATASAAVTPYVASVMRPLCAKFDGFMMSDSVIESCVQVVLQRRA